MLEGLRVVLVAKIEMGDVGVEVDYLVLEQLIVFFQVLILAFPKLHFLPFFIDTSMKKR